jgi:26S proteasome regulatory subunit N3
VEIFIGLLSVIFYLDSKEHTKGKQLSLELIEKSKALNRRTLDPLLSRLFFYFAQFHSCLGDSQAIQAFVIQSHRTATLRQDHDTQATLTNIILKNYLETDSIDQADKFVSKTVFPESAGNNQLARYMYYLGYFI